MLQTLLDGITEVASMSEKDKQDLEDYMRSKTMQLSKRDILEATSNHTTELLVTEYSELPMMMQLVMMEFIGKVLAKALVDLFDEGDK